MDAMRILGQLVHVDDVGHGPHLMQRVQATCAFRANVQSPDRDHRCAKEHHRRHRRLDRPEQFAKWPIVLERRVHRLDGGHYDHENRREAQDSKQADDDVGLANGRAAGRMISSDLNQFRGNTPEICLGETLTNAVTQSLASLHDSVGS